MRPTPTFGCSANVDARSVADFALPVMAAAAGATQRIRVMTSIVIAPLYHPVLLAKLVTTVDQVSGGRLDFGIGLSGQRDTRIEYDILGVPVETRGRRANEMLRVMRRLWTEEHVTHTRASSSASRTRRSCRGRCSNRLRPSGWADAARRR